MADGDAHPTYGVPLWRLVTGVVLLPALLLGGVVAWGLSVEPRLPDPMATHFTFDGTPNGSMSLTSLFGVVLPLAVVTWALGLLAVLAGLDRRVRFRAERAAMAWCTAVVAFQAAALALTVAVNLDQPSWSTARLPSVAVVVVVLVAAFFGVLAWALAGLPPELPAPTAPAGTGEGGAVIVPGLCGMRQLTVLPAPALVVAPDEHPVWQQHLTSAPLAALAAALVLVGVVLFVAVAPVAGALTALCALVTAPLASVTAVVDETGLDVRFGPLGWPRKHIAVDRVAAVHAAEIEPLQWGGWGYRIGPGRSAVVLRGGPGLVLELRDGRSFAVTVDDPGPGAALLDAYRRRAGGD